MAIITSPVEIAKLRRSGQILAAALRATVAAVKPGVTTMELNAVAEQAIRAADGQPSFLGYQNFPAALCVSINDEVVHGIPRTDKTVHEGDLVGLDLGVVYEGFFTDHAITIGVGMITTEDQRLLDDTKESMMIGIKQAVPGKRIGDISAAIQAHLDQKKYGIVRQLTGHGVGRAIHEEPSIPNFGRPDSGPMIVPGMVLAIEPMVTRGGWTVETAPDGWTVVTTDHSHTAHFEHTILVTDNGPEIITV